MKERLATLMKQMFDAKTDADASKRAIRRASAARLAQLRALQDPAARLAGLKDPALLPYDRQILEQSIAGLLPRRRIRLSRSIGHTLRSGLRHARYHWRGLSLITLILIPVIIIGGLTIQNTGHSKVYFTSELDLSWRFADGHIEVHRVPTNTAVLVMGWDTNDDVRLRFWSAAEGYGESIMSAETYGRFVVIPKE